MPARAPRWAGPARFAALLFALLIIGVFVAGLPAQYQRLVSDCMQAPCLFSPTPPLPH